MEFCISDSYLKIYSKVAFPNEHNNYRTPHAQIIFSAIGRHLVDSSRLVPTCCSQYYSHKV